MLESFVCKEEYSFYLIMQDIFTFDAKRNILLNSDIKEMFINDLLNRKRNLFILPGNIVEILNLISEFEDANLVLEKVFNSLIFTIYKNANCFLHDSDIDELEEKGYFTFIKLLFEDIAKKENKSLFDLKFIDSGA